MKKRFIYPLIIVLLASQGYAQNCGCDVTYQPSPNAGTTISGVSPGSTVCLTAGHYQRLFIRVTGTATDPILIKNCGGEVTVGDGTVAGGAIKLFDAKYVKLLGDGDATRTYGIRIVETLAGNAGLFIQGSSSDIELAHLEIFNTGFAGIQDNPGNQGGFIRKNIRIHDNYIHDTEGEGIYIGSTSTNPIATEFHDLHVYNNLIEDTGWDGVQIARATQGTKFYGNVIRRTGLSAPNAEQKKGLQIGKATSGEFYNNWIEEPGAGGLIILGDDVIFYNNVIIGGGVFCTEPLPGFNYTRYALFNNTFISTGGTVFQARNGKVENLFKNNLAYNNTSESHLVARLNNPSSPNPMPTITASTNLLSYDTSSLALVDLGGKNFRLTSASPAIDAGSDVSQYGIIEDYEGTPRPQNLAYDIGAFETQLPPQDVWLEAECGIVGNNWETRSDTSASEGSFVVYPDPNGIFKEAPPADPNDQLVYSFTVVQSGNYYLLARIRALNVSYNSFWVQIDDQPWIEWWEGMALGNQFIWNELPGSAFFLSAGSHTITFANRERGTELDKLLVSPSNTLPADVGDPATNCNTNASLAARERQPANESFKSEVNDFTVYPNPSDQHLTIRFTPGAAIPNALVLTDLSGRVVQDIDTRSIRGNQLQLNTGTIGSGLYLLRSMGDQTRTTRIYIHH